MTDLSLYACPNSLCRFYQKAGEGNIVIRTFFGQHGDIMLLHCRACGANFSENRGTLFFQLKTPREKVVEVLLCFRRGKGVRATSRITGLHRDTVSHIFRLTRESEAVSPVAVL